MRHRMTAGSEQGFYKMDQENRIGNLDSCGKAANLKNLRTENDWKVQQLIHDCVETMQIPWKHVY